MRGPQRHHDEHGGVAVLFAVLMAALIGFGAIVVDVGAMQSEKRQLQNGADAAALAVAQRCAGDDCGDVQAVAQQLVDANSNDGVSGVESVDVGNGTVDVGTRTRTTEGRDALQHHLAPILGFDETPVHAQASAGWGGPSGGTSMVPLAISWCSFQAHTGGGVPSTTTEQKITYLDGSESGCVGPSGHSIPGGFGWLETDSGTCSATSDIATAQTPGKPGASTPDTCAGADFQKLQNNTVLLPIYTRSGGSGSSGWFQIHGYAAFQVTGYRFACPSRYRWNDGGGACGDGSERFVRGYFTTFVSPTDAFQLGGPDLGGRTVALTP